MSPIIKLSYSSAYVVVHPDDYALSVSRLIKNTEEFKNHLKRKISYLVRKKATVIILNLGEHKEKLPEFLKEFQNQVFIIPSSEKDPINAQAIRLKQLLNECHWVDHVIFTGGWKNACFKHTINKTLSDIPRITCIDAIQKPFKATVRSVSKKKSVIVEIDHRFIF